jgi:two-component system sensor histidine kinase EvgS
MRVFQHKSLMMCILALVLFAVPAAYGQERPVIQAGSEIGYPPYCIVDEQGNADGFSVELMRAALDAMGFDVVFEVGPWEEVKQSLELGAVDALPLVGRTPEREDIFDFTFPYLTMHGTIVVHEDTRGITDLEDLDGRKVAVMQGDNAQEYVLRSVDGADVIGTEDFSQALLMLSRGQADAVVIQRLVGLQLIEELGLENLRFTGPPLSDFSQSFSFAVTEGNESLLEILNEGLSIVIADGTYDRLTTKWFGPLQQTGRAFDRIIVGGDKDYPPYEFLDENGEPTGFNVDLTRAIAEEIDIDVEIVLDEWSTTYNRLLAGEIDLIQGVFYSLQRDAHLGFTQPHSVIRHVIVTRTGEYEDVQTLEDLRGHTILVMQDDIMHNRLQELGMESEAMPVASQQEALIRLARGEGDCALVADMPALYFIDELGLSNLAIGENVLSPDYGYAALDSREDSLLLEFSDGLSTLRANGTYREIHNRWFAVYDEQVTALQVLKTFAFILIPLGVIVLLSLLWSYSLRKKVREKTQELEHEVAMKEAAEKRIAAQTERLNITLRSIGDGVITTDTEGNIQLINRVGEQLTGWSQKDARGRPLPEVFQIIHEYTGEAMANPVERVLATGEVIELANHTMLISRDGRRFIIADSGAPIRDAESRIVGVVLVFRDMTEDIRIQEKMQQAAKLDSIGVLAGGIAHDFNNLLSGIFGYVQLASEAAGDQQKVRQYLDEVMAIFGRAKSLTQQLLTFSKGGLPKRESKDVGKIIKQSSSFSLSGSNISCTYEIEEHLWPCDVDEYQIGQVIDNLVINAQQAMPGGGTITITAKNTQLFEDNSYLLDPGFYVHITISDTGIGIPQSILSRIFDPFFTTKQKGTGLGLATCYSIIEKHDGSITVYSTPGQGTVFHILLPRSRAGAYDGASDHAETSAYKGSGTILVLDDEQFVTEVVSHMLKSLGFSVITASSGDGVLSFCRSLNSASQLTAMLLDLTIPGSRGGREIIDELRSFFPDLPIFASSGYSQDDVIAHPEQYGFTDSIAKPFDRGELMHLLSQYLENEHN